MLRRTGFKRKVYEAPPAPPQRPATRKATYDGTTAAAVPKPEVRRHAHLLTLARDQMCLLQVPGVCCQDAGTTVSCHSNLAEHGKAGARKADDCYVVFGCRTCHSWLDQGKASYEVKKEAFLLGLYRQVNAWKAIAFDSARAIRDQAAASWALRELEA